MPSKVKSFAVLTTKVFQVIKIITLGVSPKPSKVDPDILFMKHYSIELRLSYLSVHLPQAIVRIVLTLKIIYSYIMLVCARFVQLVRSLTADQEVLGSIPDLVKG